MSLIPLAFDTTPLHTVACNHPSSEPQENEPWEPGAKKPEKLARGSVVAPPLLELDKLANRAEEGHDPGRRWSAIIGLVFVHSMMSCLSSLMPKLYRRRDYQVLKPRRTSNVR